jgi:hypothetical protein
MRLESRGPLRGRSERIPGYASLPASHEAQATTHRNGLGEKRIMTGGPLRTYDVVGDTRLVEEQSEPLFCADAV